MTYSDELALAILERPMLTIGLCQMNEDQFLLLCKMAFPKIKEGAAEHFPKLFFPPAI